MYLYRYSFIRVTMKGKFNLVMTIKRGEMDFGITCCGKPMKDTDGKAKHWNDNPVNWRCKTCGKWLRTNYHDYDAPSKHSGFEMLEMKS